MRLIRPPTTRAAAFAFPPVSRPGAERDSTRLQNADSHGGLRPDKHSPVVLFLWYLLNLHQFSPPLMSDAFLWENLPSWYLDLVRGAVTLFCCLGLNLLEHPAAGPCKKCLVTLLLVQVVNLSAALFFLTHKIIR